MLEFYGIARMLLLTNGVRRWSQIHSAKCVCIGVRGRREHRLRAGEFDLILDAARQQRNNYLLPTIILTVEPALRGEKIAAFEPMIIHPLALFDRH